MTTSKQGRRPKSTWSERCGKRAYDHRKIAARAAANARRYSGEEIRPYRCPHGCHAWHIGHPPGLRGRPT